MQITIRLIKRDGTTQLADVFGASADLCAYMAAGGSLDKFRLAVEKYMTPYNRS